VSIKQAFMQNIVIKTSRPRLDAIFAPYVGTMLSRYAPPAGEGHRGIDARRRNQGRPWNVKW